MIWSGTKIIIQAAVTIISVSAYSQRHAVTTIDSVLQNMTQKDLFSGAVLIANGDRVLLSKGYGYADRERKIPNTVNTRFSMSSGSKIFTGTAITLLAQQNKLRFQDSVGRYLKGLHNGNKIKIHQLLTHSAGVDDFFNAPNFSYKGVTSCTDLLPVMSKLKPVYEPGESCIYSTGDCILLGAIIEKITGVSFPVYINETFLKPLNMVNTVFTAYRMLNPRQTEYAVGYEKAGKGYLRKPYDYDPDFVPLSAGGVWSSAHDIYLFDKAVFSGKFLNRHFLERMTKGYTQQWEDTSFGYMWINSIKKGHPGIGHPGSSSGWVMVNEYYPAQNVIIIILSNFGSVDAELLLTRFETLLFDKN